MTKRVLVNYDIRQDVAVITINNPPVNALSPGVPEGIEACVDRAIQDDAVRAIVLCGDEHAFCAGADIREFGKLAAGDMSQINHLQHMIGRLEDCQLPTVAAIHGSALGAGLEVAMGCHYRVADPSAQLGLPEVKLGLIPGAIGTQRLPRLCGVARAAELCATGEIIAATRALDDAIVDLLADSDVVDGAVEFARQVADTAHPTRPTRDVTDRWGDPDKYRVALTELKQRIATTTRGEIAPLMAIEAVEASASLSLEEGTQKESELFQQCLRSDQSQGLIHVFFGARTVARVPGIGKETPRMELRQAAVVGSDPSAIATALAIAASRIPVALVADHPESLDAGLQEARRAAVEIGGEDFSLDAFDRCRARISISDTDQSLADADLIVEASIESDQPTSTRWSHLHEVALPTAIIATTVRALEDRGPFVAQARPERFMGWHLFDLGGGTPVVELVRAPGTSNETIATCIDLAKRMGGIAVVASGFPVSMGCRLWERYLREAERLVATGVSVERIDAVLYDFGMEAGPFALTERLMRENAMAITPPRRPAEPIPGKVSDEEIVERTTLALVNEGARILHERVALRPVDIDILSVYGLGFPAWRGGPMKYADMIGIERVVQRLREFHDTLGDHWQPSPLLGQLVDEGQNLNSFQLA